MYNVALIRYGEIVLKGNNRAKFEKRLVDNIKYALQKNISMLKCSRNKGEKFYGRL